VIILLEKLAVVESRGRGDVRGEIVLGEFDVTAGGDPAGVDGPAGIERAGFCTFDVVSSKARFSKALAGIFFLFAAIWFPYK
jgi:hypothetical protein